jgi:DNA repair exonuclease SbcCD ATPase subunit
MYPFVFIPTYQDYPGENTMDDPGLTKKTLDGLLAQLEYEEKRIRTLSREVAREEATSQRDEIMDEVKQAVEEIAQEIAALRRDLKWVLAATRAYREMRERISRLQHGWHQVSDWLVKVFTGE